MRIKSNLVSAESGVECEQTILLPSLQLLPGREGSSRDLQKQSQPVNVVLLLVPAAKEENCGSDCLALLLLPRTLLKIALYLLQKRLIPTWMKPLKGANPVPGPIIITGVWEGEN